MKLLLLYILQAHVTRTFYCQNDKKYGLFLPPDNKTHARCVRLIGLKNCQVILIARFKLLAVTFVEIDGTQNGRTLHL